MKKMFRASNIYSTMFSRTVLNSLETKSAIHFY